MTCREFADFMVDYLEGELPPEVLQRFERHVSRCPNCRIFLAQYQATVAAGRDAFADEHAPLPSDVPEDLIQAILAASRS